MQSLFNVISFNRRYVSASLVYLGMTFLLLCAVPEIILYAQNGDEQDTSCSHTVTHIIEGEPVTETVPGCPEGSACCELTGECVGIE
jgi:hypothetical protein